MGTKDKNSPLSSEELAEQREAEALLEDQKRELYGDDADFLSDDIGYK